MIGEHAEQELLCVLLRRLLAEGLITEDVCAGAMELARRREGAVPLLSAPKSPEKEGRGRGYPSDPQ